MFQFWGETNVIKKQLQQTSKFENIQTMHPGCLNVKSGCQWEVPWTLEPESSSAIQVRNGINAMIIGQKLI